MESTQSGRALFTNLLIAVCALTMILSLVIFNSMKSAEHRFGQEKTVLVREKAMLKDSLDSLKEELKNKSAAIDSLETEKKVMSEQLAQLEKMAGDLKDANNKEVLLLQKELAELRKEVDGFKAATSAQIMQDVMSRETDANIKRILADALTKITMVKEGQAITLEPIVVNESDEKGSIMAREKQPKILSIDRKNNLIVISLGRESGMKEGQRLKILGDGEELALATVIRTRYEISAAFIDSFRGKHTIQDIREDQEIAVE